MLKLHNVHQLRQHCYRLNGCNSCACKNYHSICRRDIRHIPRQVSRKETRFNRYEPAGLPSFYAFPISQPFCDRRKFSQSSSLDNKELHKQYVLPEVPFKCYNTVQKDNLSPVLLSSNKSEETGLRLVIGPFSSPLRKNAFDAYTTTRTLHSTDSLFDIERSKVEKAVSVLKDDKEKAKEKHGEGKEGTPKETALVQETDEKTKEVALPKKSIRQRIWAEVLHFYHGFKLLWFDMRIACRYLWRLANGETLTRRERRQLVRTTADLFRLAPFSVFVIVPFMEFLLPVALKIFPSMLPSTFKEENKEVEKQRKRLKVKLEMAKFLQDTIEDSAVQKRKGAKGETMQGFVGFMEKIRSSGEITTNDEILKYAKLFEDEITLDNLNFRQLRALCLLLEIPLTGISEPVMRFQLELKLRRLEADDRLIMKEGIDSLATWELQEACRARGMRSLGCTEERLKSQLSQWLELHLHHKLPTSLLLLSRTLYLPETIDTPTQIKATLSELAVSAETEAKVKISEVTGERVDTKAKLEVLKQEEELIKAEKEEAVKEKEKEKEEEKTRKEQEVARAEAEAVIDTEPVLNDIAVPVQDVVKSAPETVETRDKEKEEISVEDLGKLEQVLDYVAEERRSLKGEVKDLEVLKDDVIEYKEQVDEMKDIVHTTGESKAARALSNRVSRMISELDNIIDTLGEKKQSLQRDIDLMQDKAKEEDKFKDEPNALKEIIEQIHEERKDLISISELQEAMRGLQNIKDETKMTKVWKVLDEDEDGIIGISEALKVIELLSQENTSLASKQVSHIVDLVRKEQQMLQDRKARKQQEKEKKVAELPEIEGELLKSKDNSEDLVKP